MASATARTGFLPDLYTKLDKPLSVYAEEARHENEIMI
jgi:hypothetical protein